jgi:hypothetical protein
MQLERMSASVYICRNVKNCNRYTIDAAAPGDQTKISDAILLFRVGDFYETFGEDAIIASRVLGITLTKRKQWRCIIE